MRLLVLPLRLCAALLLPLAGCGTLPVPEAGGRAAATEPADGPLAAFARDAVPGQRGMVSLGEGRAVPVTLLRAYAAASGRECRLLRVDDIPGGRTELVCRDPDRGWQQARPLIRGGAIAVR